MHDLDRFVSAQASLWEQAMEEVRIGRKQTHWMWFVYPQLRGLGTSYRSVLYGLKGLSEADLYGSHPVLGKRLVESMQIALNSQEGDIVALFGKTDANKLRSCATLFEHVEPIAPVCTELLAHRFGGIRDERTLMLLKSQGQST